MTMTVDEARELLGKKANKYTDERLEEMINTLTVLANLAIDSWLAKTPKERKEWIKKHPKK